MYQEQIMYMLWVILEEERHSLELQQLLCKFGQGYQPQVEPLQLQQQVFKEERFR